MRASYTELTPFSQAPQESDSRGARSTSAVRPNLARLPSLKQLTDRPQPTEKEKEEREKEKPALSEITTITTNIPAGPPNPPVGSRLKLPASAVARANLAPDNPKNRVSDTQMPSGALGLPKGNALEGSKQAEPQPQTAAALADSEAPALAKAREPPSGSLSLAPHADVDGESVGTAEKSAMPDRTKSSTQAAALVEKLPSDTPNAETIDRESFASTTQGKGDQEGHGAVLTVRALGLSRPGVVQAAQVCGDSVVPNITVQSSTPDKSDNSNTAESRIAAALATGQHPLAHSW